MLLHSLEWHQYKHTKLVIWGKCKRVNFQVALQKKGSDFDMQNKRLIPRFWILVIFHFKVLSDVSVYLHTLCSI